MVNIGKKEECFYSRFDELLCRLFWGFAKAFFSVQIA